MKFKTINEALEWIVTRRNDKSSINHFKEVMKLLNNPQDDFKMIHVAGTNGKGSFVTYLRDILCNNGYKVGTLQSPHYETHLDRIRLNGKNIPEKDFLRLLNDKIDFFLRHELGMFEMDYIIMCDYFKENKVDFAIVEVGMGGRLDSTNVVNNTLMSVITTIGHDHMAELGNTLDKIAYEKCGIIKNNSKLLIGKLDDIARGVCIDEANKHNTELYELDKYEDLGNGHFAFHKQDYTLSTLAKYQLHNASLAIYAAEILFKESLIILNSNKVKESVYNTKWKGRFEVLQYAPLTILDGAHNLEGIIALKESLKDIPVKKALIFSALKRKDYEIMLKELDPIFKEKVMVEFEYPGVFDAKDVALKHNYTYIKDSFEAFEYLKEEFGCIVVCGSLYFLSQFYDKYRLMNPKV